MMKNKRLNATLLALLSLVATSCNVNVSSQESSSKVGNSSITSSSEISNSSSNVNSSSSEVSSSNSEVSSEISSSLKEDSSSSSSSTSSSNEEMDITTKSKEKYSLNPNYKLSNDSSEYFETTLEDVKNPELVEAIKFTFNIDFKNTNNSVQYYGGQIYINGNLKEFSSTTGSINNIDENNDYSPESTTQTIIVETSDLTSESIVKVLITYAGADFDFVLSELTYFYSNGLNKRSEKKTYDKILFENGASSGEFIVPLSDFENRSHISKVDLELYTESNASYVGGTLNLYGIPLVDSNVLNIGDVMIANNTNTATISLYLENYVGFDLSSFISMACYWAPADVVKLTSVTLYTNLEIAPSTPQNVVAHAGNKEVTVEWDEASYATSYEVYVDDKLFDTVKSNFCVVDNLVNGQTYEFYVVSKNGVGVSEMSEKVTCAPDESVEYNQYLEGLNSDLEKKLGKTNIQLAYENSIVSTGNNYRFKKAIEKIQKGEETTISYIGGSITVGEGASLKMSEGYLKGYAHYSYEFINDTFGANNVKYLNAGISGTGSEVGIVRAQKDVFDHNPDIIFIEFAVNNGVNSFQNETFEGLVRKTLNQENSPAVVLVFSWTHYSGSKVEEYMTNVGNYYNLPMISIHKGLNDFKNDIYSDFTADEVHPNDNGHKLHGKLLSNFINVLANETLDEEIEMPTLTYDNKSSNKYDTFQMIDANSNLITSNGSFINTNTNYSGTNKAHVSAFQNGWLKESTTENEAFEVVVSAKNFILVYKAFNQGLFPNKGVMKITYVNVNDASDSATITQNVNTYNSNGNEDAGWDNPVSLLVFDKENVGTYKVSVSFENSEDTGAILAVGYSS